MPEDEKEEVNVFLNYEKIKWNESEIEKLERRLKEVENRAWDTWTHQIEGKIEVLEKQLDNEGVNQFRNIENQISELKEKVYGLVSDRAWIADSFVHKISTENREALRELKPLLKDIAINKKEVEDIFKKLSGEKTVSGTLNRNSEKSGKLKAETDSKLDEPFTDEQIKILDECGLVEKEPTEDYLRIKESDKSTLDTGLCSYENCPYKQENSEHIIVERDALEQYIEEVDIIIKMIYNTHINNEFYQILCHDHMLFKKEYSRKEDNK